MGRGTRIRKPCKGKSNRGQVRIDRLTIRKHNPEKSYRGHGPMDYRKSLGGRIRESSKVIVKELRSKEPQSDASSAIDHEVRII